jgi:fucose 4-O-acetylase-like acetyltransferase
MHRLTYIDILKGWSILSIVFLHFEDGILPSWLNAWIGNYMISAFYFTSGWLAGVRNQELSTRALFNKRLRTLGIPYLWFSLIILFFDLIWWVLGNYDGHFIAREVYKTLTLRGIGTLWFLPALFGGEIIFRTLLNKKKGWLIVLFLIINFIYLNGYNVWSSEYRNLSTTNQIIDAPFFTINKILRAWPVIGIGYLLARSCNPILSKAPKWTILLTGIGITGFSIWICGGLARISFHYFSFLIIPMLGPIGLLLLAYIIPSGITERFLSYWGKNSLVLMATHYSLFLVVFQAIDQIIFNAPFTGWRTLIWFAITILIEIPVVWLFNNKLTFMLGKR